MKARTALLLLALGPACNGTILPGASSDPGSPGSPGGGANNGNGQGNNGGFGASGGTSNPQPGQPGSTTPKPSEPTFTCAANAKPASEPLRRLTTTQYTNTLRDLVTLALGNAAVARAVLATPAVAGAVATLPGDERKKLPQDLHGSFRRLDQDVEQSHVDNYYAVAEAVGAELANKQMGALLGPCANDPDKNNDAACVSAFVERFGALALRRPLTAEDTAFYLKYYGATVGQGIDPAGVADIVAGLLLAPGFLYQVEHGEAQVPGQPDASLVSLSGYELASRLSFHFWQSMPDATLLEAARTGALLSDAGYRASVDRLFADPRTRETLDQFYLEAYKLEDLPALDQNGGDPVYKSFAGADMPNAELRQGMTDEVVEMFRHYTWREPGNLDAVLSSELMLAKSPALARIYGMKPYVDGAAPEKFPAGQRPGLFTRAAFLVNKSSNTRPIMKGVFLRTAILCDEIPPPPMNANASPPPLDAKLSTRQVVEGLTQAPGSSCAACHLGLINPLGFLTEGFDALGRVRTEERLYDAAGKEIGRVPVDTKAAPQVVIGDEAPATGPADLARLLAASGKAHACLTRQYFRFAFGRWEDLQQDGCTLEGMRKALTDGGGSLPAMLKAAAFAPAFRQRRFP